MMGFFLLEMKASALEEIVLDKRYYGATAAQEL